MEARPIAASAFFRTSSRLKRASSLACQAIPMLVLTTAAAVRVE
jgi:hypothetical protein